MIAMGWKRSSDESLQRVRVLGQFARLAVALPILPRSAPPAVRAVFPPL